MGADAMYNQIHSGPQEFYNFLYGISKTALVCGICTLAWRRVWEQDMFQNTHDVDWAKCVYNCFPRALAPKENPNLCNQLNNLPTKNI